MPTLLAQTPISAVVLPTPAARGAQNQHLLASMPSLPGGLHPHEPMLEFDTTDNPFRDNLLTEPLNIQQQVKDTGGSVAIPDSPGLGIEPHRDFIRAYTVDV